MPPIPACQLSPYPVATDWPQWLTRREAADYLLRQHGMRFGPAALANAAVKGTGPAFQKQGNKHVVYPRGGLDEFACRRMSRLVRSTSELRDAVPSVADGTS